MDRTEAHLRLNRILTALPDFGADNLLTITSDDWEFLLRMLVHERLFEESLELLVARLRRSLRDEFGSNEPPGRIQDLLAAVAVFLFQHEYVIASSSGEDDVPGLLVGACYRPLNAPLPNPRNSRWIAKLNLVHVEEPRRERELMPVIRELAPIADGTSKRVAAMYEENPYPRWWGNLAPLSAVAGEVLVAGCGSGAQAIAAARGSPHQRITAIDLSAPSIAYGMRRAEELGISNIEWFKGDLLDIERLDRRFEQIACVGVLHHMADPGAGLEALGRCLTPTGSIRLGLYTESGRQSVVAAAALRQQLGTPSTAEGIRLFRQYVMALPKSHPARAVANTRDFFSISECRDLIFHVQEIRYTIPTLSRLMRTHGFQVTAMWGPNPTAPSLKANYDFPSEADLASLADHEQKFPGCFGHMYRLNVQKA
jgi:2-polyprenyl-3-methyl-5-hydroxy-6-metoxy-1,4-benzoquinol methylase